jgi:hypothetical protein
MGGGNKERNESKTNYNAALTTAQAESPYDKRRREMNDSILNWSKGGDYRQAPDDIKVFYNFADVGRHKRDSEVLANTRGQGVSALGAGANPTLLALDKEHRDAQFEEEAARNYQDTTARLVGGVAADNADMAGLDQAKRLSILGTTAGNYNTQLANRQPGWWDKIFGSMQQGAQTAASAFGGFRRGGKWDDELGQPVIVGEEGKELALADDGKAQVLGTNGPEVVVPKEPATVIPADQTQQVLDMLLRAASNRKGARAQTGGAQSPAVRPRRAVTLNPDEARSGSAAQRLAMPDPSAPADSTPSPTLAAEPSPRPLTPYVDTPAEFVEVGDKVPVTGRPKAGNMPAPGEEDANDALVRARLSHYPTAPGPGEEMPPGFDGETTAMRPRWSSELNKETERNLAERQAVEHPEERHGWKDKVLPLVARGFLAGMGRGGIGGGIGGAVTGAITGAVDPRAASRAAHRADLAGSDARLDQLRGQRKDDLAAAQTEAQNEWYRQRPDIERLKLDAQGLQRERQNVLAQIRTRKGSPFTPDDPLLAQAEKLGMHFSADELNNAASNNVSVTLVDPEHPEQMRRAMLNKATGARTDVGQAGYVPPVGADGMTAGTRGSLALGGRRAAETERHDLVTESQGGQRIAQGAERIGIMRQHLTLSQAAQNDKLDERDRRDAEKTDKLAAQAERYQQAAEAIGSRTKYTDPNTGEEKESRKAQNERDKFAAQAQALRRQLFSSYGDLYDRGPDGRVQMTTAQYRAMFPSLGGNFIGDAQSMGVQLTDADATGQGTPVPSPMHRPARRGSRSSSSAPAPSEGKTHVSRERFRAKYPDFKDRSDGDVDAAIRASGFEPMP